MYGIILIIAVIVISGLIAYMGDKIGMKVGKKRISLFGLRPKYTSVIITILTGVLIATITLTIILVTNNGVRQAIFRIQEVLVKIDNLNQQLTLKDQELKGMKQEIATKSEELIKLQEQRDTLEDKLRQTQQEFERALADLRQARDDIQLLEENRDELKKRIAGLKEQRQDLEEKISDLNDQIASLTENYQRARDLASQFQATTEYFMTKYYMGEDLVYQRGDIIYSDVIEGGQSQEKTIKELTLFLERANEEVKKHPVKVDEKLGTALWLQDEDIFSVAKAILNIEGRVIVNLVAYVNVPKNERVYARFSLNRDFVVFKQGELIAGTTIDAGQPPGQLEQELEELLRNINVKAIQKGLLADNQGSVGSIDFSRFYQILNQIQSYQGEVEIKVYAREDIWREDRLSSNLEFSIQPVEGNATDEGSSE